MNERPNGRLSSGPTITASDAELEPAEANSTRLNGAGSDIVLLFALQEQRGLAARDGFHVAAYALFDVDGEGRCRAEWRLLRPRREVLVCFPPGLRALLRPSEL